MFSLTPPIPITRTNYVCGKQFYLDPVRNLYAAEEDGRGHYVVLILNARDSGFWLVNELETKRVAVVQTTITKSHKKGGQSQARIGRLHDNKRQHNHSFIAERLLKAFWDADRNRPREGVLGIIVGGAAETRLKVWTECDELAPLRVWVVANMAFSGASHDPGQAYRLWAESESERESWEQTGEAVLLAEIERLIQMEPVRLDFGEQEILAGLDQYLYEKVYVEDVPEKQAKVLGLEQQHKECEFIKLSSGSIANYGGCLAVKW